VWQHFSNFTSVDNWRYLGQESNVIKFNFERSLERKQVDGKVNVEKQIDTVVTYYSKDGVRLIVIPEAFQYSNLHFELTPVPDQGMVGAFCFGANGIPQ